MHWIYSSLDWLLIGSKPYWIYHKFQGSIGCLPLISPAEGAARRKCEANGRWSRNPIACNVIECPVPRGPAGGRVSGYDRTVHAEIEFSCLTGHVLLGAAVLTCARDGRWSGAPPTCKFVDCGPLPRDPIQ